MTPDESEQFAAVFVLRISVANDDRIVTRFETYIFTASTADGAHKQAAEFGPRLDYEYRNTDGDVVTIKCLGIHDIDQVEPDSEDYPGLVSSVEFLTPNGVDPSAFVIDRNCLACFNQSGERSNFPNLDN
jgi:hypothetical protein